MCDILVFVATVDGFFFFLHHKVQDQLLMLLTDAFDDALRTFTQNVHSCIATCTAADQCVPDLGCTQPL